MLILTAVGEDRPGIVAALTRVLYEQGCNLADSRMTRLGPQFAIILLIQPPRDFDREGLWRALEPVAERLGLAWQLRQVSPEAIVPPPAGEPIIVTVYGADRPGIVAEVSAVLGAREINIVDLKTRLANAGGPPVYTMLIEADLPPNGDLEELRQALRAVGERLGVEIAANPLEVAEI
ncbi:MAG: ACT domain-containing protein [Armatimonadetes bacterium]|nr:ACT domain-containing protein [Armatimonadota bacterium]